MCVATVSERQNVFYMYNVSVGRAGSRGRGVPRHQAPRFTLPKFHNRKQKIILLLSNNIFKVFKCINNLWVYNL